MSQSTRIYDRLREAILALDVSPGQRLTERGLETELEASRTPVRAALIRLAAEGLVQRRGRGWVAAPIDLAETGALGEWREAIETAAVALAVERASDEDIRAIAELLDAAAVAHDEDAGVRAGGEFHVELAALSGNAFMTEALRSVMTRLARTRWLEVRTPGGWEQASREHRGILEAVMARDADEAVRLTREHRRGANRRLLDSISEQRRRLRGSGVAVLDGGSAVHPA